MVVILSLPRIDQIVDASAEHGMLSFLDAFSRYHQIPMHHTDEEKTSFITPHVLYCYNVMSFGLKIGATYQRLVTKMFRPLLGSTMEVYSDDMLVKSKQRPCNTPKYTLAVFNMFRVFCKHKLNFRKLNEKIKKLRNPEIVQVIKAKE